jgi:NADH-quinone oxidoreductase subunit J
MDTLSILFAVFAATTLGAALRVITARNPVHAVLYLVLAFCSAACLWMLLQAEFLALALVLVYVGAVMVLFLFVVMMLDFEGDRARAAIWRHLPVAAFVGAVIALQLWLVLSNGHWQFMPAAAPDASARALGNTRALGDLVFTEYLLPLQVAGVILLVAIVAAIALTLRRRADALRQSVGEQVRARKSERLRVVRMPAAARAPAAPAQGKGS